MVKVHQDTVDLYLKDIITEGMDHVSHEQAEQYVAKLTEQIKDNAALKPTKYSTISIEKITIFIAFNALTFVDFWTRKN